MAFKDTFLKVCAPNIDTFKRFPVPVACSIILYGLYLYDSSFDNTMIVSALVSGFFMFGIARLLAETHGLNMAREALLGVTGTAVFALALDRSYDTDMVQAVILVFLIGVCVAPFAFRRADNFSLWFYNRRLWIDVILAIIAAALLTGGVEAALASIDYLFDVKTPGKVYEYIWIFGAMVYGPFMALTSVPRIFDAQEQECPNSKWIFFLLNWVLAPLAVFYFLILYAYGLKILIVWDLPKNMIASLVTGFGVLGVITYLVGWPLREQSNALVKFLYRHFFTLLLPPTLMMFAAAFIRIGNYGITTERYQLLCVAVWFAFMGILFTLNRHAPLKYIFLSLLALAILSVAGPFGAERVSTNSQIRALKEVLARNDMLENGVAVPLKEGRKITYKDEEQISSIVSYFNYKHRTKEAAAIIPALTEAKDGNYGGANDAVILQSLNLQYVSHYDRIGNPEGSRDYSVIHFDGYSSGSFYSVAGYEEIYTYVHLQQSEGKETQSSGQMKLTHTNEDGNDAEYGSLSLKDNIVTFKTPDGTELAVKIEQPPAARVSTNTAGRRDPLEFTAEKGDLGVKLVITSGEWRDYGNGEPQAQRLSGYILLRR